MASAYTLQPTNHKVGWFKEQTTLKYAQAATQLSTPITWLEPSLKQPLGQVYLLTSVVQVLWNTAVQPGSTYSTSACAYVCVHVFVCACMHAYACVYMFVCAYIKIWGYRRGLG